MTIEDRPSPFELWQQAQGDRDEYRRLMWEHGHLIAREPGDDSPLFECGWKPKPESRPPTEGETPR